jgi:hypothetical protein
MLQVIVVIAVLMMAGPARGQSFTDICKGTISQSDGVMHSARGMNSKQFFALMKQARESQMKLGPDGYLWSTKPIVCTSITVTPAPSDVPM